MLLDPQYKGNNYMQKDDTTTVKQEAVEFVFVTEKETISAPEPIKPNIFYRINNNTLFIEERCVNPSDPTSGEWFAVVPLTQDTACYIQTFTCNQTEHLAVRLDFMNTQQQLDKNIKFQLVTNYEKSHPDFHAAVKLLAEDISNRCSVQREF